MRVPRWMRGAELWRAGVAVRRDWPDGTHDLFGWQAGAADLAASIRADRARWRRGPLRPTHSVVSLSGRDFVLHADRDGCRAPDCPVGDDAGVSAARQHREHSRQ
ncbi:hypothetical protein GCM10009682_26040 [Luedemannella flava]|uniref:Uncharacterized protein n=1 Tax=Luedemannella flava TaxID=349316 RepID=A0ABN2LZ19_9ACTN